MTKPKFELQCKKESEEIYFTLKNVSSLSISNIKLESFVLVYGDGNEDNMLLSDYMFPTSLGSHEKIQFKYDHKHLKMRPGGAREFICIFSMEDESDIVFRCIAKKDASNCYNKDVALGTWETVVNIVSEGDNEKNKELNKMDTKIFVSHRSSDKDYAEAFVDFFEDLGVDSDSIVCTSIPEHIIPNGKKIYEWLREQFLDYKLHMIFLLSDNYYKSPDCLNEMGAAWVTKADSDIVLLPGFSPDQMAGCIGKETMSIYSDGPNDILRDRIKQLRNKVCDEFYLKIPNDRRWENVRDKLIEKLNTREPKADSEDDIRQPVFDVKITDANHSLPGMVEIIDFWGKQPSISKHKNVQIQIELCNDVIVRNLKVFGNSIDTVAKKNKPYSIAVCYLESPDAHNRKNVMVLTRDNYPAGIDGYPKIMTIEYSLDNKQYIQIFKLNSDHIYMPDKIEQVITKDIEKIITLKQKMREDFYRPLSDLKSYTTEQLREDPSKKLIRNKAIIMSTDCQDSKWNTDGKYGEYEMHDFCDEGLLLWDYTSAGVEVSFYRGEELKTAKAHKLWCLMFEDIVTYDVDGNESYNEPIIYVENKPGIKRFRKTYYWDSETYTYIDNGMIVSVNEITR